MLTVLDALLPSVSLPLFTADLRAQSPGTFTFGHIPRSSYLGSLSYTKLTPPRSSYWQFTVAGWSVGSGRSASSGSGTPRRAFTAIADTGTSLALLPRKVVDDYYSCVPGAGYDARWAGVVFPCGVELPDWSFLLAEDGYKGVVPGRYMRYVKVNGTFCFGGMQSSEGIGFGIFGDVVLKAQFVVFDVGGGRGEGGVWEEEVGAVGEGLGGFENDGRYRSCVARKAPGGRRRQKKKRKENHVPFLLPT